MVARCILGGGAALAQCAQQVAPTASVAGHVVRKFADVGCARERLFGQRVEEAEDRGEGAVGGRRLFTGPDGVTVDQRLLGGNALLGDFEPGAVDFFRLCALGARRGRDDGGLRRRRCAGERY
jgi:hypothetical protein